MVTSRAICGKKSSIVGCMPVYKQLWVYMLKVYTLADCIKPVTCPFSYHDTE